MMALARNQTGLLITFEGTEGAGKSTLIQEVANYLNKYDLEIIMTREPGGNKVSEKIRSLLLQEKMNAWTELFLYEAARVEHIQKLIRPALRLGKMVLCDRFTDSSLAYQGFARGLPWKQVKTLNEMATQGLRPHLTVFLDIPPALGLKRATEKNRFEAEGLIFHKRVRAGFQKARRGNPKTWLTLKSHLKTPQENAQTVVKEIFHRFLTKSASKKGSDLTHVSQFAALSVRSDSFHGKK